MNYSPTNPYPVGTRYRQSSDHSSYELVETLNNGRYRCKILDTVGPTSTVNISTGILYSEGTEIILPKSSNFKQIYDILNND
jgi:hypothetical protein